MKYSNSPLISGTVDLTAKSNARKSKTYNPTGEITVITPHHMAGVMTAKACAHMHKDSTKKSSANYYIGNDGKIVLGVPEERRAWTSSSPANDYKAITIEVSNSQAKAPWPISDAAYKSLIELITDICVRNGIEKLNFTGDASGNLTMHKYFTKTACPGPTLEALFPDIEKKVNANLSAGSIPISGEYYTVKKGDTLSRIALIHKTNIKTLRALNPDIEKRPGGINRIFIGERIRVK